MKHASWTAPQRSRRDRLACLIARPIAPAIALITIGVMGAWIEGSGWEPAIAQTPQRAEPAIAPPSSAPNSASPQAKPAAKPNPGNWQRTLILWGAVGVGGLGALGGVMWLLRQSLNADHLDWDRAESIDPDLSDPGLGDLGLGDPGLGDPGLGDPGLANPVNHQHHQPVATSPAPIGEPPAPAAVSAPQPASSPAPKPATRRFPWQSSAPPQTEPAEPDSIAPPPAAATAPPAPPPTTSLASVALPSPAALSPTRIMQPSAIERAIQNLQSDQAADRRKAIWELGQRGDSRALRPLMEVLLNGDSKQRSLAIAALSAISSRVLEPTLEAMSLALRDSNPDVRTNAIRDLSQVYEQVTRLSQMMGMAARDSDRQVQETAAWALGKLEQIRVIAETVQSGQPLPTHQTERDGLAEGLALLENNRPVEAAPLLESAIRHKPSDADAHLALAQALEARGAIAQAFYETLTARDLYAYQGRLDAAQAIEQAWRDRGLDPDRAAYHVALANQLMQEAQWEQAQQELDLALTNNPHQPDAHLSLARLHRAQHRSIEALAHLQQARDLYIAMGDRVAADRLQSLL